ncbi:MAG: hypothetical protein WCP97_04590 [bacterium]
MKKLLFISCCFLFLLLPVSSFAAQYPKSMWSDSGISFPSSQGLNGRIIPDTLGGMFILSNCTITRFSSNGVQLWSHEFTNQLCYDAKRSVNDNIFIYSNKGVYKLNGYGQQLWEKALTINFQQFDARNRGRINSPVFLLNSYEESTLVYPLDTSIIVQKLDSAGQILWTSPIYCTPSPIYGCKQAHYILNAIEDKFNNILVTHLNYFAALPYIADAVVEKFRTNGSLEYTQKLAGIATYEFSFYAHADPYGGITYFWKEQKESDYTQKNAAVYAQAVTSSGSFVLNSGGVSVPKTIYTPVLAFSPYSNTPFSVFALNSSQIVIEENEIMGYNAHRFINMQLDSSLNVQTRIIALEPGDTRSSLYKHLVSNSIDDDTNFILAWGDTQPGVVKLSFSPENLMISKTDGVLLTTPDIPSTSYSCLSVGVYKNDIFLVVLKDTRIYLYKFSIVDKDLQVTFTPRPTETVPATPTIPLPTNTYTPLPTYTSVNTYTPVNTSTPNYFTTFTPYIPPSYETYPDNSKPIANFYAQGFKGRWISQYSPAEFEGSRNDGDEYFDVYPCDRVPFWVILQNTGQQNWFAHSNYDSSSLYEFSLSTYKDPYVLSAPSWTGFDDCPSGMNCGKSYFKDPSWVSDYRISSLQDQVVLGGDKGNATKITTNFTISCSAEKGRYREDISAASGNYWISNEENGDYLQVLHFWVGFDIQ